MQRALDLEIRQTLASDAPLISVIVPVYNKAPYIIEAIEGLAAQNYSNLEILVRDDGSTDDSFAVINSLPDKFPNFKFRIFRSENRGASFSRNYLIAQASSRIIVLMDADDIMLPGFITAALDAMKKHDARVVYSDVELLGNEKSEWCPPPYDTYSIRYDNCLTSLAMFDRQIWEINGGYELGLPFNEDWNFFIRASKFTNNFLKLDHKYFRYRQTPSGLYSSFVKDNWSYNLASVVLANQELYAVEEVLQAAQTLKAVPAHWLTKFQEFAARGTESYLPYLVLAINTDQNKDNAKAIELLDKAIKFSPQDEWLTFYLLGELIEKQDALSSYHCFNIARIRRPDVSKFASVKIRQLISVLNASSQNKQTPT